MSPCKFTNCSIGDTAGNSGWARGYIAERNLQDKRSRSSVFFEVSQLGRIKRRRPSGWEAGLEGSKNAIFYLSDGFPMIAEKAATPDRPCDARARCQIHIQAPRKATPLITLSHDRSSTPPPSSVASQTWLGTTVTRV